MSFFLFWNVTNVPFLSFSLGTGPGLGFRPGTPECCKLKGEGVFFFAFGTLLTFLFSLFL